ncbi:MAG: class I SAM-dependent methyltransferase [Gammaproteobacteria bacterium]|jgi:ubiquinone/menaquinone biosynthesis C-methylase UbiE|tara:strand:- start:762 stop:1469 length:708 start_codon:yes stop_codon:yes gene_type:complete
MNTIKYKKLNLKSNQLLLDMGCGEGRHSIGALLETSANVIGLDLSIRDLEIAKSRLNDFNLSDISTFCTFGVGNINDIPLESDSLDAVMCSEVLEHVDSPEESIQELVRVLKPGGVMALSVPRYLPELICWKLSKEYSETPGGHVRIFKHKQLKDLAVNRGLEYQSFHWAHGLHSPYWWLQCLFWTTKETSSLVRLYHKLLVWDLMKKPLLTKILEAILQPLIGKSLVMYFRKPN